MISKLKKYIDKESFIAEVNKRLSSCENLIIDSFISNNCNLKCNHCYFGDTLPLSEPMTLDKWEILLNDAINEGVKHFHFSGKESFLDKRIFPILELISEKKKINNLFYGVVSNGTSLDIENYNKVLLSNISYLEISLEGLKNFNDKIRGKGMFYKIFNLIDNIDYINKLSITSTIFEENQHELIEMIDVFRKKGVTKFNFAPIVYYDGNKQKPIKSLSSRSILDFVRKCNDYIDECNDNELLNIRVCLTKQIAYDLLSFDNFLSKQIFECIFNGKRIIFQKDEVLFEINFPLLNIPYLNELIITHDGYVISCADDIHYRDIKAISLPNINVKNDSFEKILYHRNNYINQFLIQNLN